MNSYFSEGQHKNVYEDPAYPDVVFKELKYPRETEDYSDPESKIILHRLLHSIFPEIIPETRSYAEISDDKGKTVKELWVVDKTPLDPDHEEIRRLHAAAKDGGLIADSSTKITQMTARYQEKLERDHRYHRTVQTLKDLGILIDTFKAMNYTLPEQGSQFAVYLDDVEPFHVLYNHLQQPVLHKNYNAHKLRAYIKERTAEPAVQQELLSTVDLLDESILKFAQNNNLPITNNPETYG
ncbi:MAG: hypothetical protein JNK33_06855 [Candidatus Doudnabacteria bacterium]|nr:hypothetical protein [Candidatus Doudnabacteria bacterium]